MEPNAKRIAMTETKEEIKFHPSSCVRKAVVGSYPVNTHFFSIAFCLLFFPASAPAADGSQSADDTAWPPAYMRDLPKEYLARLGKGLDEGIGAPPARNASDLLGFNWASFAIRALPRGKFLNEINEVMASEACGFGIFPKSGFRLFSTVHFRAYGLFNHRAGILHKVFTPIVTAKYEDWLWRCTSDSARLADVTDRSPWEALGSENTHICQAVGHLLAAQYLKDIPEYASRKYEDGSTAAAQYQTRVEHMKRWIVARIQHGALFEEYAASYQKWTLPALFNLYDFCDDPALRRMTGMFLDIAFMEMAEDTAGVQRGTPKHRNKEDKQVNDIYTAFFNPPGVAGANYRHWITPTSGYYPPPLVEHLVRDACGRGRYSFLRCAPGQHSKLPGDWRLYDREHNLVLHGFATPSYVMGTHRFPHDVKTQGRFQRWEGVVFANDPGARIAIDGKTEVHGGYMTDAVRSVQDRNVWVCSKWGPCQDPGVDTNLWIYFSPALETVVEERADTRDGWVFAKSGAAFAAVKVVEGGYTWIVTSNDKEARAKEGDRGHSKTIPTYVRPSRERAPIIIVAGDSTDYDGNFGTFQAAVKAQPIHCKDGVVQFATVTYEGLGRPGKTNGKDVDYTPALVWDSPFMRSERGSGVVYLRKGNEAMILDFSDPKNPRKTVGVRPDDRFPTGAGLAKPIVFTARN
jgi:hypothetical protein